VLRLSQKDQSQQQCRHVTVIAKKSLDEGATLWAQGGIAAVIDPSDSIEAHVQDTLNAGAGLCDPHVVRFVSENSKALIDWLVSLGVPFTPCEEPNSSVPFHLTQEGGHRHRRILHVADHTGRSVEHTLLDHAKAHENICLLSRHEAIDLIKHSETGRVMGAYVLHPRTNTVKTIQAQAVVLATGGASKAYLYTSNPDTSTGDGIAMAWRAGCRIANMEFNQFHPTCLYHPQDRAFLISEAVRGEGGILCLPWGERFMHLYDDRGELAPRDIVARAIDSELKKHGIDYVLLDITHRGRAFIKSHFPTIYERLLKIGIDMTQDPIPVVPAAHYTCGGVLTGIDAQTDIPGLWAVGEVAYTGLHGANRLASNSLIEGLVFGRIAAESILNWLPGLPRLGKAPLWDSSHVQDPQEQVLISHDWDEIRRTMWDYVGIVRSDVRLKQASKRIKLIQQEVNEYYRSHTINSDLIELRNLALVAELIVLSARRRKESRGLHYNKDYPHPKKATRPTILKPC
jgi:L-aspartate oxidase